MTPADPGGPRTLLPYVPIDRRQALARGVELPERTEGSALFADLSGFTALTEDLARTFGPQRGAEELSRYLARVYGALVAEVHAHRGSVIGFSGDAVTCWFDRDDGGAAVASGFALQRAMAALPPAVLGDGSSRSLALKVALVRGPAGRFLVGDPAIQTIEALVGGTLDRLAACEKLARPGEVVAEAGAFAPGAVRTRELRTAPDSDVRVAVLAAPARPRAPNEWPPEPEGDESWARAWVLRPVRERLARGAALLAAEFRPAAALFLAFRGLDYDHDPGVGARLDDFVRWVQGVVAPLGGAVVQLTFGDKGSYLYATFGAPVAHDDDAARAVAAARALRAPPHPFVTGVRIGLAFGQMYAGAYGAATRCTYGVLGPGTNLAARLMARAAPGEIWCDDAIAERARRQWRFRALPPVRLKGVAGEVAVFAPGERVASEAAARPPIGRRRELGRLRGALARLERGAPGVLLLAGEAGIGKSRLLAALARRAAARGVGVVAGRGDDLAQATPYRAWKPLLAELLDLPAGDAGGTAGVLRERVAALAPDLARWSGLLADVVGFDPPDDVAALGPEVRRRNLAHLVAELLRRRAAAAPLALLLDDAQRLDSVSWELLAHVARAARAPAAPLLLALAYRPAELSGNARQALAELDEAGGAELLPVGELEADAVNALLARRLRLRRAEVPADLAQLVRERAAGNPLFVAELLRALLDAGALRIERPPHGPRRALLQRGDAAAERLPDSLRGLFLARLDRAPATQRTTLKVASVVGARFRPAPLRAALETVAPLPGGGIARRLRTLVARRLLATEAGGGYAFRHAGLHEAAYHSLLFAQRRTLHRAVAAWHERHGALPPRERDALLAHHYARAATGSDDHALLERARELLTRTAEHAERLGAFAEAARAHREALALLPDLAPWAHARARVRVALGGCLEQMGAYDEAESCFAEALPAADAATQGAALAGLCLVHTRRGAYEEARTAGGRALEIADAHGGEASLAALVRGRLGIVAALQGDFAEAERQFEAAFGHYRELQQPRNAAAWGNNLGLVLVFERRWRDAEARLGEALALARSAGARDVEAQVLMNLGLAAHRQGELDEAAGRYRSSLALCRELLARQDALTNVVNLGDIALARGAESEAWTSYLEAAVDASELGAAPKALEALRGAAEVLTGRGRHQAAAETLGLVLHHPASNVEVEQEARRVLALLEPHLPESDLADALQRGAARSLDEALADLRTREAP